MLMAFLAEGSGLLCEDCNEALRSRRLYSPLPRRQSAVAAASQSRRPRQPLPAQAPCATARRSWQQPPLGLHEQPQSVTGDT